MTRLNLLEKYLIDNKYENIPELINKFEIYCDILLEWNNKFNLTSITDIEDIQIKHFIDSLSANSDIQNYSSICDIGCGAGFPSIPLTIVNPHKNFTLIDSVNKKITFIEELIKNLALKNVAAYHSRIEDFSRSNFQKFDCCVARAVAQMPTLAEYTLPLLRKNGVLIAYKGINYKEELDISKKIICLLNSKIDYVREYILLNNEKRYLICIKKTENCSDKYPRGGNKPRLQPIVG